MKRILLGGTFAGLVVFIFSAIDHMALPTGHMGVKSLPQEDLVLGAMGTAIKEPGLYVFPGMDFSKKPTEEEQKAYIARYNAGPTRASSSTPWAASSPCSRASSRRSS